MISFVIPHFLQMQMGLDPVCTQLNLGAKSNARAALK